MTSKIFKSIKFLFTVLTFFLGLYFFFIGYIVIYKNKFNFTNLINNDLNLDDNKDIIIVQKNQDIRKLDVIKKIDIKKSNENQIVLKVKKNDTFFKIIDSYFPNNKIKNKIINELNKEYNLKNLKINQKIFLYKNIDNLFNKIIIPINLSTDIIIKIENDKVVLSKEKIELKKDLKSNKFSIKSSLYTDGLKAKVPVKILTDAIKLFSFDIDFQRDIQKDNELEISYETFYNENKENKENISYGNINYIKLILNKKYIEYFIFKTDEGFIDYFDYEGKNVKKALLKTPIDGARLSSSFGVRKHPISGYNKLHKGVDFAAKKGTPVFAGGNGVIEYIGNNGGYGKYIRIRHNNSYKTAYAHLNNFKKNLYKGDRVNQGDVIGYVGSTGNSTGPHLHYEIIFQNKQINPMKMKLPSGKILKGTELNRFKKLSKKIYSDFLFTLYE